MQYRNWVQNLSGLLLTGQKGEMWFFWFFFFQAIKSCVYQNAMFKSGWNAFVWPRFKRIFTLFSPES